MITALSLIQTSLGSTRLRTVLKGSTEMRLESTDKTSSQRNLDCQFSDTQATCICHCDSCKSGFDRKRGQQYPAELLFSGI
jgi:hypothetical protein